MRIQALQHVAFEGLGYIEQWAKEKGHSVKTTKFYEGDKLPQLEDFDLLVILGGPMATHEDRKFLWLKEEKRFIAEAVALKKRVIGLGLGAQLIAESHGCEINKNPYKEIGFFDIHLTPSEIEPSLFAGLPKRFLAFHWHNDFFQIPLHSTRLAESKVCANQAFQYKDHVLGLQFHLEFTPEGVEEKIKNSGQDLTKGQYIQTVDELNGLKDKCHALNQLMATILDNLASATISSS